MQYYENASESKRVPDIGKMPVYFAHTTIDVVIGVNLRVFP